MPVLESDVPDVLLLQTQVVQNFAFECDTAIFELMSKLSGLNLNLIEAES